MNLRHYLTVLARRKWIVVTTVFVVVGSAIGFSAWQTPIYQSHARVVIRPAPTLFQAAFNYIDPASIETEIELFHGEGVQSLVRDRLGSAPGVTASVVGNTAVIDVAARSTNPRASARVATTYAEAYVDYRRQEAIDNLLAATKELQRQISALDKEIAAAEAKAAPESVSLRAQRDAFKVKLDQASVDTAIKNGGATLVSRAGVPRSPVSPTTFRNAILGLFVGLITGVAIVFLVEQFDDSLKTKEDIEALVPDLLVLGIIPRLPGWKNRAQSQLVSLSEPTSAAAEAYKTLRTSVQFLGEDRRVRTILVTSPAAGDGKTTTVANLAVALARSGQRVVVVSCDLRRPRIHDFFGISDDIGFTSVLLGAVPLSAALHDVPGDLPIRLLPSGPLPLNPAELLSSLRTVEVLASIESQCDAVLIDCPPVLPVTDATVLSSRVDGTLLVVQAEATTKKQLSRSVQSLRQVDAEVLGVVLNSVTSEDIYGYNYDYYRQVQSRPRKSRRRSKNGGEKGRKREADRAPGPAAV